MSLYDSYDPNFSLSFNEHDDHAILKYGGTKKKVDASVLSQRPTQVTSTAILPPVTRYLTKDTVVIERPPMFFDISYVARMKSNITSFHTRQTYRIPLPWQVYILSAFSKTAFKKIRPAVTLFVRKEPLTSLEDSLYGYPLPNRSHKTGFLCFASYPLISVSQPLGPQLLKVINEFWTSGFNRNTSSYSNVFARSWPEEWPRNKTDTELLEWLETQTIDDALNWSYKEAATLSASIPYYKSSSATGSDSLRLLRHLTSNST